MLYEFYGKEVVCNRWYIMHFNIESVQQSILQPGQGRGVGEGHNYCSLVRGQIRVNRGHLNRPTL